jgi:HPt (histidine-containing phosphotransfer) domain-containing protein
MKRGFDTGSSAAVDQAPEAPMIRDAAADPDGPGPSAVVFDRAGFADRMMNDEEFMRDVLREFLLDAPGQIADLRSLIDRGDAREAGRRAHQIKGAASNVGGEAMREVAQAMEEAGGDSDLERLMASIDELERQFVLLGSAIQEDHPAPARS